MSPVRQPGLSRPASRPAHRAGWALAVLLLAAAGWHSGVAEADTARRHEQRQSERGDRDGGGRQDESRDIGPARAAAIARDRFGGKVLKVESRGAVYRVKLLLPDGKVRSVYIEASQ